MHVDNVSFPKNSTHDPGMIRNFSNYRIDVTIIQIKKFDLVPNLV